jgi:hypothetical protein
VRSAARGREHNPVREAPAPLCGNAAPDRRRCCQVNPCEDDHRGQRWTGDTPLAPDAALAMPVISRQVWNCCAIFCRCAVHAGRVSHSLPWFRCVCTGQ